MVTTDVVDITFLPATSIASHTLPAHAQSTRLRAMKIPSFRIRSSNTGFEMNYLLNPSKEARTISPGRRLKNFLPTVEFTIELVKNPDTLTTPERIPRATSSDIFVSFFTLKMSKQLSQHTISTTSDYF